MPPKPLVDLKAFDLDRLDFGLEEIQALNPHRYEFQLIHGVIAFRPEENTIIGEYRAEEDSFWVRGHIPGRPLLPGVLMVEAAAQLCSFYYYRKLGTQRFFGFGGIENTKFRGQVVPGDRLVIACEAIEVKPRRAIFECQGFVKDQMVFETRIKGVVV